MLDSLKEANAKVFVTAVFDDLPPFDKGDDCKLVLPGLDSSKVGA